MELEEDEVDLRRYCPAGGPIMFSVLELPAPPKSVRQWMMRKGMLKDTHTQTHTHTHTHTQSLQSFLKCSRIPKSCLEPFNQPPATLKRQIMK